MQRGIHQVRAELKREAVGNRKMEVQVEKRLQDEGTNAIKFM